MDSSELPTGQSSPRQELRGPRPTHLKVPKDPCKIKRAPVAPPPPRPMAPPPQHRPPVIIYTETPRVIHTTPSEFRSVVQRLTGAASSSSATANAAASRSPSNVNTVGEMDPIEKGARTSEEEGPRKNGEDVFDELGMGGGAPNFFPPSMDTNSPNLLHEPSSSFDGNNFFMENTLLSSPAEASPGGYWDPFNNYQDFDQFDP